MRGWVDKGDVRRWVDRGDVRRGRCVHRGDVRGWVDKGDVRRWVISCSRHWLENRTK